MARLTRRQMTGDYGNQPASPDPLLQQIPECDRSFSFDDAFVGSIHDEEAMAREPVSSPDPLLQQIEELAARFERRSNNAREQALRHPSGSVRHRAMARFGAYSECADALRDLAPQERDK